jgi:hypothetical protein
MRNRAEMRELRFNLSFRDVEELLVERGVALDHVTVYRWVQRFTPLLAGAARFARHSPGDRWHVDETYIKVNGVWRYVYRAVDQRGQVIDVLVSARRNGDAARNGATGCQGQINQIGLMYCPVYGSERSGPAVVASAERTPAALAAADRARPHRSAGPGTGGPDR